MDKIKSELIAITEKYKKEYSNAFDRNGTKYALANNVVLASKTIEKLSEDIVYVTNSYCEKQNLINRTEIDEFKNDLHTDFIQFSTTFQG